MTDPQVSFKDHFSSAAAGYATYRPSYPAELVRFLASVAPRHEVVWDAGCGSGQLSTLLADRFGRVVATDASAAQIANATPHDGVEYRCAPAEASGLPDRIADLAVVAQAAHWFDLDAYYAEVRRVTRPGAAVALITYANSLVAPEVDPVVWHFYSEVLGAYWPPERRHTETGYRLMAFPFDPIDAPAFEIRMQWTRAEFAGYIDTWSAVRAIEKAVGRAPVETFMRDLTTAWGAAERRTVRWPLSLRVGRV